MSAPKFNARIAIATAFSTQGGTLLHFEIQPIAEEGDEIIHVEDAEAEYWGIYARIQEPDGEAALAHWIADIDKQAEAQAFCDILNEAIKASGSPAIESEFIHPEIESMLATLNDQQPYNYKIEKTSCSPDNWRLYIWEADADQEYFYESKADAENDVRMAAKHYRLELINFDALPSIG